MKHISNSFTLLGLCLSLSGLTLVAIAFIILQSTPLTALGLSTIILGAVSFALGRGQPKISPEASEILLQSGIENISAIVEELGLKSKAIYLPSSMTTELIVYWSSIMGNGKTGAKSLSLQPAASRARE